MFDLNNYLYERRAIVDRVLDLYLPTEIEEPASLHKAMRYSIFCGGKRIRPILALAGAEIVGAPIETAFPTAAALEMIHTFSLIHDDLPALDDDDLRRGRPTCHKAFGEAMAILAGDALLALAFETIASKSTAAPDAVLAVLKTISEAVGTLGMVGGQVADLENERNPNVTLKTMQSIHERKTGALLSGALVAGAQIASAPERQIEALRSYGENVGLAFQIADDLLDVVGNEQILGKPIGSDEKNHKSTYPSLLGLDGARRAAQRAVETALDSLEIFGAEADSLRSLASFMIERKS
jgi:geranylgeranyl diphosphate synthase type II